MYVSTSFACIDASIKLCWYIYSAQSDTRLNREHLWGLDSDCQLDLYFTHEQEYVWAQPSIFHSPSFVAEKCKWPLVWLFYATGFLLGTLSTTLVESPNNGWAVKRVSQFFRLHPSIHFLYKLIPLGSVGLLVPISSGCEIGNRWRLPILQPPAVVLRWTGR